MAVSQTANDNEDSIFDMLSTVSSNPVPSQPKEESMHGLPGLPLASKEQKSPSTRCLMYKTSANATDASPSLIDSIAPTLSESSNLPSSEEEPIPAILPAPPKPAKLVKPAESPAKSALKPALKSTRPAGKSDAGKTPVALDPPKPLKLVAKPPTKPSKSPSTKLPSKQPIKSAECAVAAKTPIPAVSASPVVTMEMVEEVVGVSPSDEKGAYFAATVIGGVPVAAVCDRFIAGEVAEGDERAAGAAAAAAARRVVGVSLRVGAGGEEAVGDRRPSDA